MKKRIRINKLRFGIFTGLLLFIILAAVFAGFDLQISQALYNPNSRWASAFGLGGRLAAPVVIAAGLNFVCWNRSQIRQSKWYNIFDEIIIIITILLILIFCGGFRGWWQEIIVGGIYFSLYSLIQFRAKQLNNRQRRELEKIIVMTIIAALIVLIVVEIFKNVAGRPRFRDLQDVSQFVPWYRWDLQSGGRSFPSGHTANACGVIGISFAAQILFRDKLKRIVVGVLPVIYMLLMALSRVIMGAHYASDVLFSLGIAAAVWLAVYRLFGYRKKISRVW